MNKHFSPIISEEKFAAWLDGMLPPTEMQEVAQMIDEDSNMQAILSSLQEVDDILWGYSDNPIISSPLTNPLISTDFELPDIPSWPIIVPIPSTQVNLTPDFLPDNSFDTPSTIETQDSENSLIDMQTDINDTNF